MAGDTTYRTLYDRVSVQKACPRTLTVRSVLTFPVHDLAGDWVDPDGLNFKPHEADPSIDLEHARTNIRGYPVAWARASLSEPGAPYALEMVRLNCAGEGEPDEYHTLPVGTNYFDQRDRISTQTFALVEQGALPAVSLEFAPVRGAMESLGRSPLERRDAYRFRRANVVKWTLCAVPVNPGALHVQDDTRGTVAKSLDSVPLSLATVLRDGRVNVGGTWEPLSPIIRKALVPLAPPITRTTVRVEKAMEPDEMDEFNGNLGDADMGTENDAEFADEMGGDEVAHPGVQTMYQAADGVNDLIAMLEDAAQKTESAALFKDKKKFIAKLESLKKEMKGTADKHDTNLMAMKGGEQPPMPDDAEVDPEAVDTDTEIAEGDDGEPVEDTFGKAVRVFKDVRPVYKKALALVRKAKPRTFRESEIKKAKSDRKAQLLAELKTKLN
jgi:hypothetical protein